VSIIASRSLYFTSDSTLSVYSTSRPPASTVTAENAGSPLSRLRLNFAARSALRANFAWVDTDVTTSRTANAVVGRRGLELVGHRLQLGGGLAGKRHAQLRGERRFHLGGAAAQIPRVDLAVGEVVEREHVDVAFTGGGTGRGDEEGGDETERAHAPHGCDLGAKTGLRGVADLHREWLIN
jgi:hypothetical protein